MTRHNPTHDQDRTPSDVVAQRYREAVAVNPDDPDASLALLTYRGGQEELAIGLRYAESEDVLDRVTGADILGQLGWADQTFQQESVDCLLGLLSDPEPEVVCSAAISLGHRRAEQAIPLLLALAGNAHPRIRYGVVHGLMCHETSPAVEAMISLVGDSDEDVRNWATFALGSQMEVDGAAVRDALIGNLADANHEIRGEALVGLAERRHPETAAFLQFEWQHFDDVVSMLSLEAAELIGSAALLDDLVRLRAEYDFTDDAFFAALFDDAIAACK